MRCMGLQRVTRPERRHDRGQSRVFGPGAVGGGGRYERQSRLCGETGQRVAPFRVLGHPVTGEFHNHSVLTEQLDELIQSRTSGCDVEIGRPRTVALQGPTDPATAATGEHIPVTASRLRELGDLIPGLALGPAPQVSTGDRPRQSSVALCAPSQDQQVLAAR